MNKFIKPEALFGKTMSSMIDPREMLRSFVKHDLIEEITSEYHEDVFDMCRNGSTWLLAQLKNMGFTASVAEGHYQGRSHSWVVFSDYYLDMTLAQFEPSAPQLAIVLIDKAEGYTEDVRHQLEDWIQIALTYG